MAAPKGNQYAKGNKGPPPRIWTDDAIENEAAELINWADTDKDLWLKDFAHKRGYSPCYFSEWKESNKVFAKALEYAKDKQERKFYNGAMSKELDMTFVKYFMPRILKDRPEWLESFGKEEKESKASDLVDFLSQLMLQAKGKPNADSGA